jgi:hypothetical protein
MTRKQWLQELLTRSADGRFPSVGEHPQNGGLICAYRDPKGNACAAGLLIPDANYDGRLEGKSASYLHSSTISLVLPAGVTRRMVEHAQYSHDDTALVADIVTGKYSRREWNRDVFLAKLRELPELVAAFAEEGLVIE